LAGPVLARELAIAPRRGRVFIFRTVYISALLILMCTSWLVLTGSQTVLGVGDLARFGATLFRILVPLQLALVVFLSALGAASSVAVEKDRRTLLLLLLTRLSDTELVVGKLLASLLMPSCMLLGAIPVFLLISLFGGVETLQVAGVFLVAFATLFLAGSLGSTLALWREKTFQTLSMTMLLLVLWIGIWEAVHALFPSAEAGGVSMTTVMLTVSPVRATLAMVNPLLDANGMQLVQSALLFAGFSLVAGIGMNLLAIIRLRNWNPSREVRSRQQDRESLDMIWQTGQQGEVNEELAEAARATHVDSVGRARQQQQESRSVWDNPILWREVCTWAYGRKVLIVRVAYLLFFAMAAIGVHSILGSDQLTGTTGLRGVIPAVALPLAPFFLVSMVIINALAVNSITNERDGQALDLLLVTDISPFEFVTGKMWGGMWIAREMIALPLVLCVYTWIQGGMMFESLVFISLGLLVITVFVSMLGIHCGMIYSQSRTAITISMGAVFFLFLGVITCIMVMISFSGSFQQQLAPFLAFILGGSVGLYVSLGIRNPSQAILWSTLLLPFATFYAITSFLIHQPMSAFLVIVAVYGFTTAAMMIPAIGEFDIAMGRTKAGEQ
jgi:ABC-type transport system involved in multi-copper enzyme maturation permease subunit